MKPIDYLGKVEPVVIAFFDALLQADISGAAEQCVAGPAFKYYQYQFEHWSGIEDYDEPIRMNHAHAKAAEARQALLLIGTASSAAAGSILQIAKICISMAWSKDVQLMKGRKIGSQPLSAVIWHARNQALHFEEGIPQNKQTNACLAKLHEEIGLDISSLEETPRSLAREIIGILEWHSYTAFADDIMALLGSP